MICFVYEHCPFSMRPLLIIGLKKMPIEIRVLPFSDRDTPVQMVGKKVCPILQKEDGSFMIESLDIATYLDHNAGEPIITNRTIDTQLEALISRILKDYISLTSPRFLALNMKEFQTNEDRQLYQSREEAYIGATFQSLVTEEVVVIQRVQAILPQFEPFIEVLDKPHLIITATQLCLFAYMRNLSCVPGLILPDNIQDFVNRLCEASGIGLLEKVKSE